MKRHIGSTLDSLFEELGEKQEVDLLTQKKLLAARIAQAMARRKITHRSSSGHAYEPHGGPPPAGSEGHGHHSRDALEGVQSPGVRLIEVAASS